MEHQPFNNWILDDILLSAEQMQSLEQHLQACPECAKLKLNFNSARRYMLSRPQVSPAPGFSQRWKESLVERRILQQKVQARRFLLFITTASLLSLLALLGYLLATWSPATLVVDLFQSITQLFIGWSQAQQLIQSLWQSLPTAVPIAIWIIVSTTFAVLGLIWVLSLWRISLKGVIQHENNL